MPPASPEGLVTLATDSDSNTTGSSPHADAGPPSGGAVWSGALFLTLVGAGLVLLTRVVVVPWVESANGWVIPQDLWTPSPLRVRSPTATCSTCTSRWWAAPATRTRRDSRSCSRHSWRSATTSISSATTSSRIAIRPCSSFSVRPRRSSACSRSCSSPVARSRTPPAPGSGACRGASSSSRRGRPSPGSIRRTRSCARC